MNESSGLDPHLPQPQYRRNESPALPNEFDFGLFTKGRLIRHSAIFMVARMLPGLFGLATTAILTRLLDPQEYGQYGLMLAVMMMGSMILFDWLGVSFLRFYQARPGDPSLIGTFVGLFCALLALSVGVLLALWATGAVPHELIGAYTVGMVMVWAISWFELLARFPVAQFQPMRYFRMHLIRSVAVTAGATAGAWLTSNAVWTAIGTAAGILVAAWSARSPIQRPSWARFDRELARHLLIFGVPLAVSMGLGSMIDGGTRLLLALLDSAQALGFYTAASVLVQSALGSIGMAVSTAGYSRVVLAVEREDHAAAQQHLLSNGALLLAVLAPASIGLALTGKAIATIFVGPKLVSGVIALMPWMAASTFLSAMRANHLDQAFQLGKRPHLQIWMQLLAATTSVALCFYLIPTRGSVGAAMALTAAMAVSGVYALIMGRYAYWVPLPLAVGARVAVCCGVMVLVIVALPDAGWTGLALRTVLGAVSYGLVALAVNLLGVRAQFAAFVKKALD